MARCSFFLVMILSVGGCPAPIAPPEPPAMAPTQVHLEPPPLPKPCLAEPVMHEVPGWASRLAIADLDGDGALDVVVNYLVVGVAEHRFVSLRGDGKFGFAAVDDDTIGEFAYSFAVGDYNRDGLLDFAANDYRRRRVRVYAGEGGAAFAAPKDISTRSAPSGLSAHDVNGDGELDIVVEGLRDIQVLFGDGRLGFRAGKEIAAGQAPDGVVSIDLDGDGKREFAVITNDSNELLTLETVGGELTVREKVSACRGPSRTQTADLNGDGRADLVYHCNDGIEARITGGATTQLTPLIADDLAIGDLNGDDTLELIATTRPTIETSIIHILEASDDGYRETSQRQAGGHLTNLQLIDVNGDSAPDLVGLLWGGTEPAHLAIWPASDCGP